MEQDLKRAMKEEVEVLPAAAWKRNTLIIGAVAGAAVGLVAAYLILQRYGDERPPDITLGEGVKIGVIVAGLLRSIANL